MSVIAQTRTAAPQSTSTASHMLHGFTASCLVYCFEKIGLWKLLAERDGLRLGDAADRLGVDRQRLEAMVIAATRFDVLESTDADGFRLTALGRALLTEKSRFIIAVGGYGAVFQHLAELSTGLMRYGVDVSRDDGDVARGCAQMQVPEVVGTLDSILGSLEFETIVDIGCADASRLVHICRAFPHVHALAIDVSVEACDLARRRIASAGLESRIRVMCGDLLRLLSDQDGSAELLRSVDVVTTSFLLHHMMADEAAFLSMMRRLQEVFANARQFIIADHVRNEGATDRDAPIFSVEFELLHSFMDVPTPTRADYERLFRLAGLRIDHVHPFGHPDEWVYVLCRA